MTLFKPHFMQPLIPGFQTNFSIPESFVQKYIGAAAYKNGETNARLAILRDQTKKIWRVKVSYDKRRFQDGWHKFCKDHNLHVGDFLVFKHLGSLVFHVTIFDNTACERSLLNHTTIYDDDGDESYDDDDEDEFTKMAKGLDKMDINGVEQEFSEVDHVVPLSANGFPYFSYEVKQSNIKNGVIVVPIAFAKRNGLRSRWCDIVLRNDNGWSKTRKLRCNRAKENGGNNHYIYCKPSFFYDNGFNIGDHLIFELLPQGKTPITFKFYRKDVKEDS